MFVIYGLIFVNYNPIVSIRVMQKDFTGASLHLAMLALIYYAFIWNHIIDPSISDSTYSSYTLATGRSDDISILLCF